MYGDSGTSAQDGENQSAPGLTKVTRVHHVAQWKSEGRKFAMLTAYDYSTAKVFEQAGIPILLVGDSAANTMYGYDSTVPVTVDEMAPLVRAVTRGAPKALVVADLVFGSYEASPQQAVEAAAEMMKRGNCHAVKLEGGVNIAEHIRAITNAGIPVMAHIGFTPQSVNGLGGFRVQGRGESAEKLRADARAVQEAGAFSVVMEMVPSDIAGEITRELEISTIGIGAGNDCDGQVLVWQDFAGMTTGRTAKFVKRYAELADELRAAAVQYAAEVTDGSFPDEDHSF